MSATVTVPTTVEELAAGIAADIRRFGHYQGQGGYWPGGPCCVILAPSANSAHGATQLELQAIVASDSSVGHWNDTTPTDEVLAVLDRIAAGLNWREQGLDPKGHDRCPECQVGLVVHVGTPERETGHQNVACTECGFTS